MKGYDYPVRHFELMVQISKYLKTIGAQLLRHEYYDDSFGSWWFTFTHSRMTYWLVLDGRDGILELYRGRKGQEARTGRPEDWEEIGHELCEDNSQSTDAIARVRNMFEEYLVPAKS